MISSKYTTQNLNKCGAKILFMTDWKVAGEFANPCPSTLNSYCPCGVVNAVLCASSGLILIWKYPEFKSRDVNNFDPPRRSKVSSILGSGYRFLIVILFRALQSHTTRCPPAGFATNMTGAPKGELLGAMNSFSSKSLMYVSHKSASGGLILLFFR